MGQLHICVIEMRNKKETNGRTGLWNWHFIPDNSGHLQEMMEEKRLFSLTGFATCATGVFGSLSNGTTINNFILPHCREKQGSSY